MRIIQWALKGRSLCSYAWTALKLRESHVQTMLVWERMKRGMAHECHWGTWEMNALAEANTIYTLQNLGELAQIKHTWLQFLKNLLWLGSLKKWLVPVVVYVHMCVVSSCIASVQRTAFPKCNLVVGLGTFPEREMLIHDDLNCGVIGYWKTHIREIINASLSVGIHVLLHTKLSLL